MTTTETTTRPSENTITRRTMLKNIAVSSATATMIGVTAAVGTELPPVTDDAELIGLEEQYAQLKEQNRALLKDINPLNQRWADEIVRRNIALSDTDALRLLEDEIGLAPMQDLNEFLCDQMGEIECRALKLHPTRVEGIRAKLLIAWGTFGPEYNDEKPREDQDWHIELMNEALDDLDRLSHSIRTRA